MEDITDHAGLVVIAGPGPHAAALCHRDLDMVDVFAVPKRLKNAIAKAKSKDVLDRFFAEVMVHPVDLVFLKDRMQFVIQDPRRFEIAPKRLFNHDPPPAFLAGFELGLAEVFHDGRIPSRRC